MPGYEGFEVEDIPDYTDIEPEDANELCHAFVDFLFEDLVEMGVDPYRFLREAGISTLSQLLASAYIMAAQIVGKPVNEGEVKAYFRGLVKSRPLELKPCIEHLREHGLYLAED